MSVGADNRPAILAQRLISYYPQDGAYGQSFVTRQELVLLRTNAQGQLTNSFVLDQTNSSSYGQMLLQPTPDGGFTALCQYTTGNLSNWQLLKISPSGVVVWRKSFDPLPESPRIYSLVVNAAGEIYTGGFYYRNQIGPVACIAKLSPVGDVIWAMSYADLPGAGSYGNTLTLTPEGGCVLSGRLRSSGGDFPQNSFLLKTNAAGGLVWSKTYYMPGVTAHYSLEDGYLLTGQTNTAAGFALYLSKTFPDGTPRWYRDNLLTGFYNMPTDLFVDNNRYIVIGNGSTPVPAPSNGFLWAQFDDSGHPLSRIVSTAFSGPNVDENGRFQNVVNWPGNGYLTVDYRQSENEGIRLALVGYDGQPKWVSVVVRSVR